MQEFGREYILQGGHELRIVVGRYSAKIKLKSGACEVFGTELIVNNVYTLEIGSRVAVFTWHGCTIEIQAKFSTSYMAEAVAMVSYLNSHWYLEELRREAHFRKKRGPITMIVGPKDVGKSTMSKILLNYAIRMSLDWKVTFVELDVGQGDISIPGAISSIIVEKQVSVQDGFDESNACVYHYGYVSLNDNSDLYIEFAHLLAEQIFVQMEINARLRSSGVIINSCGWTEGKGYDLLVKIAEIFQVDNVFTIHENNLHEKLVDELPRYVKHRFIPKSDGITGKDNKGARSKRLTKYFYGMSRQISSNVLEVKFSDMSVFQLVSVAWSESNTGCGLQMVASQMDPETQFTKEDMLHRVLSRSSAKSIHEICRSVVSGFICVTDIDIRKRVVTLVSPNFEDLRGIFLVWSAIKFSEHW